MPIDYTKIKKKINGQVDPFEVDQLTLRVGVVSAINANGTANVVISGVTVPNISRLAEATIAVDAVVQMLSYRGSLLILGRVAVGAQTAGLGLWARGQTFSDSSGITSTTPVSLSLVTNTVTFVKNRVYEVKTFGGVQQSSIGHADLRAYRSPANTQIGEFYRFPCTTAGVVFNAFSGGIYFTVAANTSGAVQLYGAASAGTMTHRATGAGGTPRNIEVYDVGDISQYTGVVTY